MLKFMFLGTNGSIQERDQGNTSLLFKGTQGRAVVDLSCNLATVVREDIDAVIFTHEHIDHVYGLPSLLHQMWLSGRKKPLVIYAPEGMHPFIDRFLDLFSLRQKTLCSRYISAHSPSSVWALCNSPFSRRTIHRNR